MFDDGQKLTTNLRRTMIPTGVPITLRLHVQCESERRIAETVYRDAWFEFCFSRCNCWRRNMAELMDGMQSAIGTGPDDPRWQGFAKALPAFLEQWERMYEEKKAQMIAKLDDGGNNVN